MNDIKIAIFGSYRKDEIDQYHFKGSQNDFFKKSEILGKSVAVNKYTLVVGWSNHYLSNQAIIDEKTKQMKYSFEDTADYHAMRGYLLNKGPKLILYMSPKLNELFELCLEIKDKYRNDTKVISELSAKLYLSDLDKIPKIIMADNKALESKINDLNQKKKVGAGNKEYVEKTYLGYLLGKSDDFVFNSIMRGHPTIEKRVEVPDYESRSQMLRKFVVKPSDCVIIIGGGKATDFGVGVTIEEDKLFIPFSEFGGEALTYLNKIKTRDIRRTYYDKFSTALKNLNRETIIIDDPKFFLMVKKIIYDSLKKQGNNSITDNRANNILSDENNKLRLRGKDGYIDICKSTSEDMGTRSINLYPEKGNPEFFKKDTDVIKFLSKKGVTRDELLRANHIISSHFRSLTEAEKETALDLDKISVKRKTKKSIR